MVGRSIPLLLGSVFTLLALAVIATFVGSVSGLESEWILELRLPRVLLALGVGAGLAVSGALLQALFSNPLCEPYTIGISSGAALGAVIGLGLNVSVNIGGIATTAFIGSLAFTIVLYLISLRPGVTSLTLLLSGVMMSFLGSGLLALWMSLADSSGLQGAIGWLLGDLSRSRLSGALFVIASVSVLSVVAWMNWKKLDILLLGESQAEAMGVDTVSLRRALVLLSSIIIGTCVSASGMIGFVGLVIPHFVRRISSSLHFTLIPLCFFWGGSALILSDLIARVIASPYELPVGVVTALLGAPLFLWVVLGHVGRSRI